MPTYALQWEAIKIAKEYGCTEYDMFGVSPGPDHSHPMYGLYQFKTGFGGELFHHLGCWDYLLDFHANLQGNSFANWAKVTPRQNAFIQRILNSSCHVICTMRSKQEYVLNERNGKMIPEKVGLKAVQRDNVDYEFTIVFDVNMKHYATASKDRTELFAGKPEFPITSQVGTRILDWCNQCQTPTPVSYGSSYPAGNAVR